MSDRQTRRFGVGWRNVTTRVTSSVAVLQFSDGEYTFWYRSDAHEVPQFRAFIGFPELSRVYKSHRLFPFFDVRVMDKRRRDFTDYVEALGLPADAPALDILSRSGGERKGDTIRVAEQPWAADDGGTEAVFLVRGVRYATADQSSAAALAHLKAGDELELQADRSNPVNKSALLITSRHGQVLGWVPDLLLDYVAALRADPGMSTTLVRNNGPSVPSHLRLLVRVAGKAPDAQRSFSGGAWEPNPLAHAM